MTDIERVWQEFWIPTFDGREPTLEEIKKELYDFYKVMKYVPKVYCHATGGAVSKVLTDPDVLISLIDDHINSIVEDEIEEYKTNHPW